MKALRALKSRREGVEKIDKIARAMEAIASTRLHRYEAELKKFKPFTLAQRTVMSNLALRLKKINSPWAQSPHAGKEGLMVAISSDRGFCGGFNNQLFQKLKTFDQQQSFSFVAVGKKGARYLKKQGLTVLEELAFPDLAQTFNAAQHIAEKIITSFTQKKTNSAYLLFNEFRHNLLGQSQCRQLLPLQALGEEERVLDCLFEPDMEAALGEFLPVYVQTEVKAAILESQAAEEMARLVAMTHARRNADDLISELTQKYHKARQAGITRELVEIAGAI